MNHLLFSIESIAWEEVFNNMMSVDKKLQSKLPDIPGVYLFYNKKKELIYVGKATSLKSRVKSYFSGVKNIRPIELLLHEVSYIDWTETDSVLEAIILEANTIKKFLPKYNIVGRDDKSWNYIGITKDVFPKVVTVRQHDLESVGHEGSAGFKQLFGPYPGLNTRATMKVLRKIFHFSTCKPNQKRPCLYHEMGQCLGVCTGEISPTAYRAKVIRPLVTFLSGRKKYLLKQLEIQMRKAAKGEDFEEAARLRNQISALQRIQDVALLNKSFVEDQFGYNGESVGFRRIEGFDISNLGSTGMVGSMVVFENGESKKSDYRKFRIRTVGGQSDVDCLEEMLRRRLKHTEWTYPKLFLIDGGLPQVNRVKAVLKDLDIDIPIVGIAKGPDRKRNDIILGTKDKNAIDWLYRHTRLLIHIRDEAHRFAVTYQRTLRRLK